jgi:hypothetical protein
MENTALASYRARRMAAMRKTAAAAFLDDLGNAIALPVIGKCYHTEGNVPERCYFSGRARLNDRLGWRL